ncbi:hypothetical protein POTOM_021122 [Populus tomentosa]|uniref:Uncharacterized protein n=1 Tax=Populus tomentosa TaxID=118781 RepID=A0A8X8D145_POPTO|nr:hypothetical protein POTOM_021122 [Populus tomentosa]
MDSSMCATTPNLEIWIIQGTLGSALMGKQNGIPNNLSSQTKNYEITPFILGKQRDQEKAAINRIFLTLPSRKEEREILFPFRRDQEIGSSRLKKDLRVSKVFDFLQWMQRSIETSHTTNQSIGTLVGGERQANATTIDAMIYFTGEVFGSSTGWPSRAKEKKIMVAYDYFIHSPLGSGGYCSVGRALLLQLDCCDYKLDV